MNSSEELRGFLDGDDSFMVGHQIIKKRNRKKIIPEWSKSDKKIREILLRSFPCLESSPSHRNKASRWARVIYLYFRMNHTHGEIAEELNLKYGAVISLIRSIKRSAKGLRADGTGVRKQMP